MNDPTCRICGSKEIYCLQETSLVSQPWVIVHLAYCKRCAREIELLELQMIDQRVKE